MEKNELFYFGDLPMSELMRHADSSDETTFGELSMSELAHCDDESEYIDYGISGDIPVDELMHYGIPGMKWGIRRYQNKDGSLTSAGKKRQAKLEAELGKLQGTGEKEVPAQSRHDRREAEKLQKTRAANLAKARQAKLDKQKEAEERANKLKQDKLSIKEMTDAEIQAKIDRIKLENTLKDLMKEPAGAPTSEKKTSKGKEIVKEILTDSAKNIGKQTVTLLAGEGVNKVLKELFNNPEMSVNPKKGQKDK